MRRSSCFGPSSYRSCWRPSKGRTSSPRSIDQLTSFSMCSVTSPETLLKRHSSRACVMTIDHLCWAVAWTVQAAALPTAIVHQLVKMSPLQRVVLLLEPGVSRTLFTPPSMSQTHTHTHHQIHAPSLALSHPRSPHGSGSIDFIIFLTEAHHGGVLMRSKVLTGIQELRRGEGRVTDQCILGG